MRFTPKVRVAFLLPVAAALMALIPLLFILLDGLLQRSAESHLERSLHVVSKVIAGELGSSARDLQTVVRGLASTGGPRITVIGPEGLVSADSSRTWEEVQKMDNHGDRPEVLEALAEGVGSSVRRSATLGQDFVYSALPISGSEGQVLVLRLSEPLSELDTLRSQLIQLILVAVFVSLLVVGIVSWWLHRHLAVPLEALVSGADRMARGEFSYRNPIPDEEELAALARSLNRLGQRVEEHMEAAQAERGRMEVVGDSMSEGVLVTDATGRATLANPSFRDLYRVRGQVVGKTPLELTASPKLDEAVQSVLQSGEPVAFEMGVAEGRTAAVSVTTLTDRSGVVVAARDISELMAMAEMRRDLVANVSHELKTPLAAIRGFAETLRDGALEDPSAAGRFIDRILVQCRRLQSLLEDLLTLSRLERDEQMVELRTVDLVAIVRHTLETLGPLADERQVAVQLDLAQVSLAEADAEALANLCSNLLDNAIKYNESGGSVEIRLRRLEGEIVLEVVDSGPGIPEAALPRLFERFYRVDRGRSRAQGGTGLGLAIVKHAAQRHGGTVEVESTFGEGSTFRVRLPTGGPADADGQLNA